MNAKGFRVTFILDVRVVFLASLQFRNWNRQREGATVARRYLVLVKCCTIIACQILLRIRTDNAI